jgi:hypothetical protein
MMMLKHFIILFTILSFQENLFGQTVVSDTTFILRENNRGDYHAIFIENNKASKYYDWIANFKFGEFDTANYVSALAYLKKQDPKPLVKYNFLDLQKQWCPLYVYKASYYLYSPSDYMGNHIVALSDSSYIDYGGDGPTPSRITSFSKTDDKTYKFGIISPGESESTKIIHIIDKEKGIAVFEDISSTGNHIYELMVSANKMRNFPIIVNYCETAKTMEYKFVDPDFQKLLKGK